MKDGANLGADKIAKQFQEDMKEITGMELAIVSGQESDADDILIESEVEDTYTLETRDIFCRQMTMESTSLEMDTTDVFTVR